eukprot:7339316-Pyramimonas_sp.AAC.1
MATGGGVQPPAGGAPEVDEWGAPRQGGHRRRPPLVRPGGARRARRRPQQAEALHRGRGAPPFQVGLFSRRK